MFDPESILYFFLLGSFVGIIAGMFGIGGGGVIVPVLTYIFLAHDFSKESVVHVALGTSMAATIATTFASFRAQQKRDAVHWGVVKMMVPGILVGTFASTFIASHLNSFYLAIFFSCFFFIVGIRMLLESKPRPGKKLMGPKVHAAAGGLIGGIAALVSIAGGAMTVPYLIWQSIDVKKAIGTSSAVGFPIAIVGTVGYIINGWSHTSMEQMMIGYVYLPAMLFVALGSYLCAPLGVKLMHYLPGGTIKKLFAILPLVLSIKMITSLM